jgi:NitT/TauT family transport system ATP-binding protein
MPSHTLPSYLDQSDAVRARFERLKQREAILKVSNLHKTYDRAGQRMTVLEDINLTLYRREFLCVVGPSGCGKSTLARIIAGLDPYTSGEVILNGQPVRGPGKERGMVFQGYTLFPWLSVRRNVMFGLEANGTSRAEAHKDATQWLQLVGLEKFADAYPHQLSGGMKQRVAIVRALATQPSLLLMDEPFGALDAQTRVRMQTYLMQIWRRINISVLFITHDLDEAILLADRILVLSAHPGRTQELIEVPVPRPRTPGQNMRDDFLATRARLDELIHAGAHEAVEEEIYPMMARMAELHDDVE